MSADRQTQLDESWITPARHLLASLREAAAAANDLGLEVLVDEIDRLYREADRYVRGIPSV